MEKTANEMIKILDIVEGKFNQGTMAQTDKETTQNYLDKILEKVKDKERVMGVYNEIEGAQNLNDL